MGIYIKGMEMPENCMECPLETDYGTCGYYSLYVEGGHESDYKKRRDDCPLIAVPPHSRLIDAYALKESIKEARKRNPEISDVYDDDYFTVAEWLASAPTIIEAEEER